MQFNTPVLKDGMLVGLSNLNSLFCVDAQTGTTLWSAPLGDAAARGAGGQDRPAGGGERGDGQREGEPGEQRRGERADGQRERPEGERPAGERGQRDGEQGEAQRERPDGERPRRGGRGSGGRGFGGRGGGRGGYGSVVDAGSVMIALVPSGELTVFAPGKEYKKLAEYKVAQRGTYAYLIASGKRIFVKDQNALTLWTVP